MMFSFILSDENKRRKKQRETVWLTQDQMSELFDTARSSIAYHIGKIFKEGELDRDASVEIFDRSTNKASRPPQYKIIRNICVRIPNGFVFYRCFISKISLGHIGIVYLFDIDSDIEHFNKFEDYGEVKSMAFQMIHMEIAYRLLKHIPQISNASEFILGSVAPDCVHMNPNYNVNMKVKSHMFEGCGQWGDTQDYQLWKRNICFF